MQQVAVNYVKQKFIGKASERIYANKPSYETDPEVLAAVERAEQDRDQHWWKRNKKGTIDVILNQQDRKILTKVKRQAWYLDKGCHCCCFNIGLDGVVGLIPGIGDIIGAALALQLIRVACQADLPHWLIAKMTWNVLVDFMIGLTPIAGDLLDILFKCNWRNALLLEEYLILRRRDELRLEKGQHLAEDPREAESSHHHHDVTAKNDKYEPNPIPFTEHIFDFDFHPSLPIVAIGLINGQVHCYNYGLESNSLAWKTQISKKSCRDLLSISRDKSIQALDVSAGRILYKVSKAHKFAINKLKGLDSQLTATGDDEGIIKIWDMRTCKAVQEYKAHKDYISDMVYTKSTLIAAGGDGQLSIFDIRKPTDKIMMTQELDDEPLSLVIVKNDEQVIAGSQSGALYTWNWNTWSDYSKWIGHPNSVDALCKLDEDTICTGGSDGLLRLITVSPQQQFEGILGDHGEDFPIEKMAVGFDEKYLASCGHDLHLRFWNIEFLYENTKRKQQETAPSGSVKRAKRFFQDL
ncbi:hypothetical protein G6F23_010247 [Rhizopus arrhizus]|nr:hypothetical protein G6F23_010247 [Rhizopus arrhizus]